MGLHHQNDAAFLPLFALLFFAVVSEVGVIVSPGVIGGAEAAPLLRPYFPAAGTAYSPYRFRGGWRGRSGSRGGGGGGSRIGGGGGRVGGFRARSGGGDRFGGGRSGFSPSGRNSPNAYVDESFAFDFLQQFGYIPERTNDNNSSKANSVSLETSIADFQRVAGIPQTGYLDKTTKTWMKRPRCVVKSAESSIRYGGSWTDGTIDRWISTF